MKIHARSCWQKPTTQNFTGTCAANKVKQLHLTDAQEQRKHIKCGEDTLKNVYVFKYLGSLFTADGDQTQDVGRRIGMAISRMGDLRQVFNSGISFRVKMKIFKTAICSLLTYGCEAWTLDERIQAKINGANARCLCRFTGKDAHQEASCRTRTFDLVMAIRRRRFKWLGHLLRLKGKRLVKLATRVQFDMDSEGGMFMDLPADLTYDDICALAQERTTWKEMSECLGVKARLRRCIRKSKSLRLHRAQRRRLQRQTRNQSTPIASRRAMATNLTTPPTADQPDRHAPTQHLGCACNAPPLPIKWKCDPVAKPKKKSLSDYERAKWAREYYHTNFAAAPTYETTTTSMDSTTTTATTPSTTSITTPSTIPTSKGPAETTLPSLISPLPPPKHQENQGLH